MLRSVGGSITDVQGNGCYNDRDGGSRARKVLIDGTHEGFVSEELTQAAARSLSRIPRFGRLPRHGRTVAT